MTGNALFCAAIAITVAFGAQAIGERTQREFAKLDCKMKHTKVCVMPSDTTVR